MKSEWNNLIETVYQIAAKARKDKAFEAELTAVVQKYLPDLFPPVSDSAEDDSSSEKKVSAKGTSGNKKQTAKKANGKEGSAGKKTASKAENDVPVLNPLEISVDEEDSFREKLMELEIPQLRTIIRAYDLDPLKQTTKWKTKSSIVDKMMEVLHQRLIDGAALRRN